MLDTVQRFQFLIPEIIEKIKNKKRLGRIKQKPTTILIYRDPKTLTVRFFELEPGALAYIKLLKNDMKEEQSLKRLINMFGLHDWSYKKTGKEITKLKKILRKSRIILAQN